MPVNDRIPQLSRVEGHVGHDPQGKPIVVAPDSMADATLIHPTKVSPEWTRLDPVPMQVHGIGNTTISEHVQVPIRQQWGAPIDCLTAYIAKTPQGVDLLLGVDNIDRLAIVVDRA